MPTDTMKWKKLTEINRKCEEWQGWLIRNHGERGMGLAKLLSEFHLEILGLRADLERQMLEEERATKSEGGAPG